MYNKIIGINSKFKFIAHNLEATIYISDHYFISSKYKNGLETVNTDEKI